MERRLISTGSPFEAQIGYSRAVVQGDWCFMAGVTGYDYATMQLPADIAGQARNCFSTVRRVLGEAGFTFASIIRVTHYVANRGLVDTLVPVLGQQFGGIRPAATMVIAGLMRVEMLYEVEEGDVMENWQRGGFGVYIHWPFCEAKCPYCDFNSHVVNSVDQVRWRDAMLRDLSHWAERTPGRRLTSIFFGGGTPSLMPPETVGALIEAACTQWTSANDLEVTLEANPTSVEAGRFGDFVDGGVNRFSVGLQALQDADLRALGRLHSVAEGRRAYEVARALCDRVSFDLIYARQNQTRAAWSRELRSALSFAGEHASLYQLTVEAGTAFGARQAAGGLRGLPNEDIAVDLFEETQAACRAAGLPRYETSNHARPGAEARHNLIYWRGGDWVGIGPGAHGRVGQPEGRLATVAHRMPDAWLRRNESEGTGIATLDILQGIDIAEEYMIMALRTTQGVDLKYLNGLAHVLDERRCRSLCDDGLLQVSDDHLCTTERGALLVNAILAEIVAVEPV